jgi:hypothetical protein
MAAMVAMTNNVLTIAFMVTVLLFADAKTVQI